MVRKMPERDITLFPADLLAADSVVTALAYL
jgi:hypothetical protein